jgi:hypothetical protein
MAPFGHGWGIRLMHAVLHACVPVIIQDGVRQVGECMRAFGTLSSHTHALITHACAAA